jgi:erythromycin esterase
MMRSLQAYVQQHIYFARDGYEAETVRDKQMAENFLWLYRYKYPGQKIIIWAHNYHIAKNTFAAFPLRKYGKHYSMGNELAKVLKDTMYILGFTSYGGKAGRVMVKPFKVPAPKKNSIERWMAEQDPAYAFVDLKAYREANPADKPLFFMKGKFHRNAEAVWTDVFDGVFYIKQMYPCRRK